VIRLVVSAGKTRRPYAGDPSSRERSFEAPLRDRAPSEKDEKAALGAVATVLERVEPQAALSGERFQRGAVDPRKQDQLGLLLGNCASGHRSGEQAVNV
jgi:hypothetical protein